MSDPTSPASGRVKFISSKAAPPPLRGSATSSRKKSPSSKRRSPAARRRRRPIARNSNRFSKERESLAPLVEQRPDRRPRYLQLERSGAGLEGQAAETAANIAKVAASDRRADAADGATGQ